MVDVLRDGEGPAPRAPAPTLASIDDIVGRSATAGLVVTKSLEGRPRALPASVELAAYRIVQEAITNVVRHSRAGHASVVLGYGAAGLTVRVDDDGRTGVRPDGIVQGNGLRGMQERAAALGGRLSLTASPLGGLRVEARLPTREGP
jgi:signal transduction histidine kinase